MLKSTLLLISFAFIFVIAGCNDKKVVGDVIVEGFVENLPDGKVYLTDAYDWKVVFDSATTTSGHFKLHIKTDTSFVPFLASVRYPDSTFKEYHQMRCLIYLNSYETKGKIQSGTSGFFLGPEGAVIKGKRDLHSVIALKAYAGKDNELYQRLSGKGFGYMRNIDSTKRIGRIQYFKRWISSNPNSYFLLKAIIIDKENYTEKELEDLLSLFKEDIQKSSLGKSLRTYLANRTDQGVPYTNLVLSNAKNEKHSIINPKNKLNMLIFWASWCGPCRQEIPALKKIYQTFQKKGLHMASISIDKDQGDWHKALSKENMGWQQLIVQKDQIINVKQQFNFNGIPLIILTDSLGKEIMKTTGYSDSNMATINGVITNKL